MCNNVEVSINDFNALVEYYGKKYVHLLDDTCETYDHIKKCIAYVENTSLPACHEHVKVQYKMLFDMCLEDYYVITEGIDDFPFVVDKHCQSAQCQGTMKDKENCQEFLDALLSYHEACASSLNSRVSYIKTKGKEAHVIVSRLPRNTCT